MSINTYAELVSAVSRAAFRDDLTSDIDNFIALCESDMQRRLKLVDFENTATLTVTSGSANLPTGYRGMRNVYWSSSPQRALQYITPDKFDSLVLSSDLPNFYTIKGTSIKFATTLSGDAVINYRGAFTGLSGSNTTNAILTNHPDAYLHGVMYQLHVFLMDQANAQARFQLYEKAVNDIRKDDQERRYGSSLQVRPA